VYKQNGAGRCGLIEDLYQGTAMSFLALRSTLTPSDSAILSIASALRFLPENKSKRLLRLEMPSAEYSLKVSRIASPRKDFEKVGHSASSCSRSLRGPVMAPGDLDAFDF
jgi:hypothetical protein